VLLQGKSCKWLSAIGETGKEKKVKTERKPGYQVRNEEGKCAARNKFCRADWVRHGGKTAFIFGGKSFRKIFRSDLALVLTEVNKSEAGGGLKQRTIGH